MKKNLKIRLITMTVLLALLSMSVSAAEGNQKTLNWAKNLLVDRIDKAIDQIENMKSAVDSREEFSSQEKEEIKSNLNSYIGYFEDKKGEVEAAETLIDLRLIVMDLRYEWKNLEDYKDSLRGIVFVSRFEDIGGRAENLSNRIDVKISELNASEEEKDGLKDLKTEFDAEINLMEDKVSDAEEKFKAGENTEGYSLLMEAKNHLQEAYNTLKDIVKEFRRLQ